MRPPKKAKLRAVLRRGGDAGRVGDRRGGALRRAHLAARRGVGARVAHLGHGLQRVLDLDLEGVIFHQNIHFS